MDITEFGFRLIGSAFEGRSVGNVDLDRAGADVESGELAAAEFQLRLLDIRQYDVNAVACQRPTDAKPDAVGSAGHECGLAGKIFHRSTGIVFRLPASA
jgi:hypothetical protein